MCVAVSFLCVLQCASFEVCDERCKGLGERCNPWALSFLCVLQCLSCVCCSVRVLRYVMRGVRGFREGSFVWPE